MAYFTIDDYKAVYGSIDEKAFSRLSFDACRKLDNFTTGADGVKKLRLAFPTDEQDAEAVKRCGCHLVYLMLQMEAAEQSMGYEVTENGLRGKVISSVSAGNESVSYSTGNATMIDKALSNPVVKSKLFWDTVREYLSGVSDANGVNLLYMGVYPHV